MKLVYLVTGLVLLGVSVYCLGFAPDVYAGKAVFNSEGEYRAFKEAVASEEVSIESLDVLSSEPPIVVNFSVGVPHGASFEFGDKFYGWTAFGITGLVGVVFLVGMAIWMHRKDAEEITDGE